MVKKYGIRRKTMRCTLPNRPLFLRSEKITLILSYSRLVSARATIEGHATHPFHRNGKMSCFCLQRIMHFCHRRPTFQILQSRSSQGLPTATLPPSLIFQACPLIGQWSSWRRTAMAPTWVGYTPMPL